MKKILIVVMSVCFAFASSIAHSQSSPEPEKQTVNAGTPENLAKIKQLLTNYTASVSSGDRARFEAQLLSLDIPFSGIGETTPDPKKGKGLKAFQGYQGFRNAIFDGGKRYRQRFSNVKIEQLGNLAQVSLDYETALAGEEYDGKGWKVLQLIKYEGEWKIASEFYIGYPAR